MRIEKKINLGKISWSNTNFSELTLLESKENYKFDLGVKGLTTPLKVGKFPQTKKITTFVDQCQYLSNGVPTPPLTQQVTCHHLTVFWVRRGVGTSAETDIDSIFQ